MQSYEKFDKDCLGGNQTCYVNKNMKSQIGVLNTVKQISEYKYCCKYRYLKNNLIFKRSLKI